MDEEFPKGLIFSPTNPRRKKKALRLIGFLAVLQLCLIWPVYPLFGSATPQIFGFPLSFAWVIGVLLVAFITLLIYFRNDQKEDT